MNNIARLCLLTWIFKVFTQVCIAMDDDQRSLKHFCLATHPLLEERLRESKNSDVVNSEVAKEEGSHRAVIVDRPVVSDIVIPDIARGYEEIYLKFLGGFLIYKKGQPDEVRLPIASLANPLEGIFDLSGCGDSGRYLSIHTGYRKKKIAADVNKVEIWIVPKFVVERELDTTAEHLRPIMRGWTGPVGLFWTWGRDNDLDRFDYLVTNSLDDIASKNLRVLRHRTSQEAVSAGVGRWAGYNRGYMEHLQCVNDRLECFICELK